MSEVTNSAQRFSRRATLAISSACLLIFFTLALQTAIAKTPTADEGMHLLRAQVLRQTDELRLQGQHTPLSHRLIGLFFGTEPTLPAVETLPSWSSLSPDKLVQDFLWRSQVDVSRLLLLGRLPVIYVALLTGAMITRWFFRRNNAWGAGVALILFAFSPNLLASAALATTDLVATAAYLAALLAWWHYWQRPSSGRWLIAGLTLGLAISAKLTGALLLPLTLLLAYIQPRNRPWWRPAVIWLSLLPVAGFVLWATYGFEIGSAGDFPVPLPAVTFLSNFLEVQAHIERGHYAFLLGQRSNEGWWFYFVIVYLFKTPIPTLVLLAVAIGAIFRRRQWGETAFLGLPAVLLFAAASLSRLNIGYRHILPIVPLIWLMIGETGAFWRQHRAGRFIIGALLAFYALGSIRQLPHFLAYFNEMVGGSEQGYRYLGDSNLDWGQDLKLLADYVRNTDADPIYVSYFGPSDMAYYGLNTLPLFDEQGNVAGFQPANPAPGRYIISANHLQGATEAEPDIFAWFRRQDPIDNLGYSLLIYDVVEDKAGSWIAHCYDPVAVVDEKTAEQLVGGRDIRHAYFDCRSSWVFPTGSDSGWTILPTNVEPRLTDGDLPANLTLEYTNSQSRRTQPYSVYYWSGSNDLAERLVDRSAPLLLDDGSPVAPGTPVGGVARFLGGRVYQSTWASMWQVLTTTDQPLSILMHLYGENETPVVGDGLGYTTAQWIPGDIFIQYHGSSGFDGLYLETGLYNYVSGERLPLADYAGNSSVRIFRPDLPEAGEG